MKKRYIAIDLITNKFLMLGRLEYYFENLKEINKYNTCKSRKDLFNQIQEAEKELELEDCLLEIKEIYIKV